MYKQLIKPLLFSIDPETIHHRIFRLLKTIFRIPGAGATTRGIYHISDPQLRRRVFGIDFPNPVGLAAGFDKDALLFNQLANLGFGFIETGPLTPKPQPGNPQPRLFRLPEDEALINRMGFNNLGVDAAAEQLKKRRPGLIVGGNIGKNKTTPNQEAVNDYLYCFHTLHEHVDYFVVNVSSPNTPGLRELQEKEPLSHILGSLKEAGREKVTRGGSIKPILLKIAPDLSNSQLDDIIDIVTSTGIDGLIASNTTISREDLKTDTATLEGIGAGGLSGRPLTRRATEVIRYIVERSGNAFPVIGAGGIHSAGDAIEKLEAGASLVQLYTGFIYEGPGLIKRINRAVLKHQAQGKAGGVL